MVTYCRLNPDFQASALLYVSNRFLSNFQDTGKKRKGMGTTKKTAPRNHYNYLVRKWNRVMMIIKRKPSLLPDQHANVE
jgi:hypothetical protein